MALRYVVYAPKTKTWWGPTAYADGSYNTESTRQTGAKSFAFPNATTQTDLTQVEIGGTWKTQANSTCTKS